MNSLYDHIDKFIFDFDDTLCARNNARKNISRSNLRLLAGLPEDRVMIISGNSWRSIQHELYYTGVQCDVWADANSVLYTTCSSDAKSIFPPAMLNLTSEDTEYVRNFIKKYVSYRQYVEFEDTFIKIKPLESHERDMLHTLLTEILFKIPAFSHLEAKKTGRTTIDITTNQCSKKNLFNYLNLDKLTTCYIGDEIDSGNDKDIAESCTYFYHVKSIEETSHFLRSIAMEVNKN